MTFRMHPVTPNFVCPHAIGAKTFGNLTGPKTISTQRNYRYQFIVSSFLQKKKEHDNYRFGIFSSPSPSLAISLYFIRCLILYFSWSLFHFCALLLSSPSHSFCLFFSHILLSGPTLERARPFARTRVGAFTFYGACKCHTQNLHRTDDHDTT